MYELGAEGTSRGLVELVAWFILLQQEIGYLYYVTDWHKGSLRGRKGKEIINLRGIR